MGNVDWRRFGAVIGALCIVLSTTTCQVSLAVACSRVRNESLELATGSNVISHNPHCSDVGLSREEGLYSHSYCKDDSEAATEGPTGANQRAKRFCFGKRQVACVLPSCHSGPCGIFSRMGRVKDAPVLVPSSGCFPVGQSRCDSPASNASWRSSHSGIL